MENSTKAIIIAASVVITLALVTVGFLILRSGQDTASSAITKLDELNNQLAESEYMIYDNTEVSGSEVVNAIKKFEKDHIGIQVITGKTSPDGKWYHNTVDSDGNITGSGNADIVDAIDVEDDAYINPNGRFDAEVVRDKNGVIVAIIFDQL